MGSKTELLPKAKKQPATEDAKRYQIVLLDDDDHTYGYVIEMMMTLFGHSLEDAQRIAYDADYLGQATVKVCPLEEAMVGREQIINYGPDFRLSKSNSSMVAIVEEADGA